MVEDQALPLLISVVGGGTIVPLVYRIYTAHKNRDLDGKQGTAKVEEIATHAAREAVEATRGAMEVLRGQLADGHSEMEALREQRAEDRAEINRLRARIRELNGEPPMSG